MPDAVLRRKDRSDAVREAQILLNRSGALLEPDGDFGKLTEDAVSEFQTDAGLQATGTIDEQTWQALRDVPEPSPDVPTEVVTFICREEVGNRNYYDRNCSRPVWPGLASGVTIGVGYDLGYQSAFDEDWADLLSAEQMSLLRPWLGKKGQEASSAPGELANLQIPWKAAWKAFIRRTLPKEVTSARNAFPGSAALDPLCFGVLVSLTYNRGTSMSDPASSPGQRKEMREIRDAVAAGRLTEIPDLFRSMKRLWPATSGLVARREREALLFEQGLGNAAGAAG